MTTTVLTDWKIALVMISIFILLLVLKHRLSKNHHVSLETDDNMSFSMILFGFFLVWWGVGSLVALIFKLPAFHFFDALGSWMVAIAIAAFAMTVWFVSNEL